MRKHPVFLTILLIGTVGMLIYAGYEVSGSRRDSFDTLNSVTFLLEYGDSVREVSLWQDNDGICHAFIPGSITLDHVVFNIASGESIIIDGVPYRSGDAVSGLKPGREYDVINGVEKSVMVLDIGSSIASLFMDSDVDVMSVLKPDTNAEIPVDITTYLSDGSIDCHRDRVGAKVSIHGNSTAKLQKKSMNLVCSGTPNFFNMGNSTEWILLSNGYDQSNLRNRIAFDIAEGIGMTWTPQAEYVDIYVNGDYQGLYLMAEKVEISDSRCLVDGSKYALVRANAGARMDLNDIRFTTELGRCIEIVSENQYQSLWQIAEQFQKMEDSFSDDDESYAEYIDTESWMKRFLIDEVFENLDSERYSSYYICGVTDEDRRVYAGPIWDYDLSMGNTNSSSTRGNYLPNLHSRVT